MAFQVIQASSDALKPAHSYIVLLVHVLYGGVRKCFLAANRHTNLVQEPRTLPRARGRVPFLSQRAARADETLHVTVVLTRDFVMTQLLYCHTGSCQRTISCCHAFAHPRPHLHASPEPEPTRCCGEFWRWSTFATDFPLFLICGD
jgi:hypothetical protein